MYFKKIISIFGFFLFFHFCSIAADHNVQPTAYKYLDQNNRLMAHFEYGDFPVYFYQNQNAPATEYVIIDGNNIAINAKHFIPNSNKVAISIFANDKQEFTDVGKFFRHQRFLKSGPFWFMQNNNQYIKIKEGEYLNHVEKDVNGKAFFFINYNNAKIYLEDAPGHGNVSIKMVSHDGRDLKFNSAEEFITYKKLWATKDALESKTLELKNILNSRKPANNNLLQTVLFDRETLLKLGGESGPEYQKALKLEKYQKKIDAEGKAISDKYIEQAVQDGWKEYNIKIFEYNDKDEIVPVVSDLIKIEHAKKPFSCGSMRNAYLVKITEDVSGFAKKGQYFVAKYSKNAFDNTDKKYHQDDLLAQSRASRYAKSFNSKYSEVLVKQPKFLESFLIKFKLSSYAKNASNPRKYGFLEPFVEGKFKKYNNNYNYVHRDTFENQTICRATPQAFSHYTYLRSNGEEIVVDLQGINDFYTDPQIHTTEGSKYGMGNLGRDGIEAFFKTHSCNNICQMIGLDKNRLYSKEQAKRTREEIYNQSPTIINKKIKDLEVNIQAVLQRMNNMINNLRPY
jgi:hypothetical protein